MEYCFTIKIQGTNLKIEKKLDTEYSLKHSLTEDNIILL